MLKQKARAVALGVLAGDLVLTAISLPLAWNTDDLPIGSHLIARYGREDVLLRVAAQLEQAQPWADRLPSVHA